MPEYRVPAVSDPSTDVAIQRIQVSYPVFQMIAKFIFPNPIDIMCVCVVLPEIWFTAMRNSHVWGSDMDPRVI
jgi:hypothetical protein